LFTIQSGNSHSNQQKGPIMNRFLVVSCLVLFSVLVGNAQDQPYKVVFDLTSKDTLDQKAVLRWIKEVTAANPKAEMEVVMYGKGYEMVMPDRSPLTMSVLEAMAIPNVTFKVCQIALRNNKVEKSQLLGGVQVVPDGIYEIYSKQQEHWGYIKVMH
jgi:uncharacterized protein